MFQRTTRKVSLTAEGLAFLSDAQQIQALTHRALDRFAHPQDQPFVPFALGSVFHLHLLWLAPALRRLREELPSLHPMLQVAGGPYLQQLLEEGSLEGVLGFALPARRKSGISFQEVRRAPMVCLLPEGHPLAGREAIGFDELKDYPCLSFEQGDAASFYFAEEILSTKEYIRTIKANDRATMLNLMVGLNGYTLCSGIICEELNGKDFIAVPFQAGPGEEPTVMEIGYITRENTVLGAIGRQYIKEIEGYLGIGHPEREGAGAAY